MITLKGDKNSTHNKAMKKALGMSGGALVKAFDMGPSGAHAEEKGLPLIQSKTEPIADEAEQNKSDVEDEEEDDPFFDEIREKRLMEMKRKFERQQQFAAMGHGQYKEISEDQFLDNVTKSKYAICHFYHPDFERCKIIDKHLDILSKKYLPTKFIKLNSTKAPFFVNKLKIQVLPTILLFKDGVTKDRIVGFEEMGGKDEFPTKILENRIKKSGVIADIESEDKDEEEEDTKPKNSIRMSGRGAKDDDSGDDVDG